MMDTALLRRLAAAAPALGEDGRRLAAALEARLAGQVRSIDQGLGLSRRGGISPAVQARNERRNALIRAYGAAFLAGLEPARQAEAMALEIGEFRGRVWPRLRDLAACPPHTGARQRALFDVLKVGGVPASARQLRRILASWDIH